MTQCCELIGYKTDARNKQKSQKALQNSELEIVKNTRRQAIQKISKKL